MRSTLILLLCLSSLASIGQLSIDVCPMVLNVVDDTFFVPEWGLTNYGSSEVQVAWHRELNDLPPGWNSAISDPNMDWSPFADLPLSIDDTLAFPIGGRWICDSCLWSQLHQTSILRRRRSIRDRHRQGLLL